MTSRRLSIRAILPVNSGRHKSDQSCGSDLLLNGKYRVTILLSAKGGFGNTYEVIDERKIALTISVVAKPIA